MSPHDVVVLLKIIANGERPSLQQEMSDELGISQSEISKSIQRSKAAGLLDHSGKKVLSNSLLEFLQFGLRYVFPLLPGAVVRGVPTAHSAQPLSLDIAGEEGYVWPSGRGNVRGQSITPLHPSVPEAALKDPKLHELLSLVDALRVGRAREKTLAVKHLKKRLNIAQ